MFRKNWFVFLWEGSLVEPQPLFQNHFHKPLTIEAYTQLWKCDQRMRLLISVLFGSDATLNEEILNFTHLLYLFNNIYNLLTGSIKRKSLNK